MNKILKVKHVADYCRFIGAENPHPLVCAIDYASVTPVPHSLNHYEVYGIFFHDKADISLEYGCGKYDYQAGTVICVAPGQTGGKEDNGERIELTGWALLFHPDILQGSALEKEIKDFSFFDYRINEALHMNQDEHDVMVSLMSQLQDETRRSRDTVQDAIIVNYLGLILHFCQRFYHRQFLTRSPGNTDILMKFEGLLRDYFDTGLQLRLGLPSVQYFADQLCMSANYFGDLVKKTTGDTAGNHIRQSIIQRAKNGLTSGASIAEVAYQLGFSYPQHLSKMFRKQTGMTPSEYVKYRKS